MHPITRYVSGSDYLIDTRQKKKRVRLSDTQKELNQLHKALAERDRTITNLTQQLNALCSIGWVVSINGGYELFGSESAALRERREFEDCDDPDYPEEEREFPKQAFVRRDV